MRQLITACRLETRVSEQVSQIGQMSKLTRFLSPKVSDLIMAGDADSRLEALAQLRIWQESDFEGIFRAMAGLPVPAESLEEGATIKKA